MLDNAEQLEDDATAGIALLAERAPRVHWLVTSPRPLGLDGERCLALEALARGSTRPLAEVVQAVLAA